MTLPTGARAPFLRLDKATGRWTALHWWGRAGEPTTLGEAHEQLGSPDAVRVVVWRDRDRRDAGTLTLDEARALQTAGR